ncbi:protein kinase 2B, chloroplastic-like [Gossypium australe]|uniref:Protein kinase 2B, chloroplastic-like n=1 Tax=Gossypium australe TaxID=47621 RepID=A0A5B6W6B7_9ROSI|nr:protein kinase 2B, chloroplastic-like [Gossypium australe]
MPNYVKFLKQLLQKRGSRRLVDCGAQHNSRSFTIDNALANLGASINAMPKKVFKKLGLGKPKHTRMSIKLADRTIRYPRGIIEDVLVKINKFIFLIDFFVLDMDVDSEVPLILGPPFLATSRTIINAGTGELVLHVGDKKIILQARHSVRVSRDRDDFKCSVNVSNRMAQPSLQETPRGNMMEPCFSQGDRNRTTYEERMVQIDELDE